MYTMDTPVIFECVRDGKKLRVRVTMESAAVHRLSPHANTQCPREIRQEGAKFSVPADRVWFMAGPRGKFFYKLMRADMTPILSAAAAPAEIFEAEECCVCMSEPCDVVLAPCGHFVLCASCSAKIIERCPICRSAITHKIPRDQL